LAVVRHYEDLRDGAARGLVFSPEHGRHVIEFIERFFVHVKGPKGGEPILLDPWQKFWTAVLYGWRVVQTLDDGNTRPGPRRFTRAYEQIARKNGKSTWKAPQAVYLWGWSGEPGAEVYPVATTRAQAMTVFQPAFDNIKRWARRSPGAKRSFRIYNGLNQEKVELDSARGTSKMEPLPGLADAMDGRNPYAILYDELHAARTPEVWDVLESALGARIDPLLSAITTAGFILDGVCTDIRRYGVQVLENERQDDTFLAVIYELDDDDDDFDERNWTKANPGLGTVKQWAYMRAMAAKAKALPSAAANFRTKDLNRWVAGGGAWFDMTVWNKGGRKKFTWEQLRGRRCYGGLDLSSTRDLTAFALVFPPDEPGGEWYVMVFFWCNQAKIEDGSADDRANYKAWHQAGWITATPGNVVDYAPVKEKVLWACQNFDVQEVAFDRWNALSTVNDLLEAGAPMVEVPQNTGGMGPGSKHLEILVYGKRLQHGANPVLSYCASNTALLFDSNGNFRPDKKRSNPNGRIDGVVAVVMALSRAVAVQPNDTHTQAFVNLND
jgi:phage terminase large subunit-like protein